LVVEINRRGPQRKRCLQIGSGGSAQRLDDKGRGFIIGLVVLEIARLDRREEAGR